ncbi:dTDP-4-dehydrorhamnose 3,5-epimerase family protein [Devosia sp.]|uniref:dTDP-4-dehydrorhamnose 3,5-epimerase family protein n=1 Tax=Devosia sp. TaxID=1871048 RepID=UPI00273750D5|nr:dTDP-4-dehydrorhamnose 3,5-epimerase family protein [Devosia sp.]MDP2782483.1 dTDP-4-dehydrorhamnose 3,5-epimerase family protein [Devosia sp.]
MIAGVKITPLRQFLDERGKVMHMLKVGDAAFQQFGEIYFSCVYPGAIKGWHIHKEMTLNYAVPHGHIKFVLYDERPASTTRGEIQEIFMGPDNHCLVTVPPLVWNGFKGIGDETAVVANCATIPHSPDEIERRDPFDPSIPYDWALKHR